MSSEEIIRDEDGRPIGVVCLCGNEVPLQGYDEECEECGRWYNTFGQMLIPPEEWWDSDDPIFSEDEMY